MNETSGFVFLIPVAGIIGAFTMIALGMITATKRQELRMRERLAMIERGLTPPPEVDPEGFDHATGSTQREIRRRFVGGGIIVVGLGLRLTSRATRYRRASAGSAARRPGSRPR